MKTHSDQKFKSVMEVLGPHLKRINNREAKLVDVEMFKEVLSKNRHDLDSKLVKKLSSE